MQAALERGSQFGVDYKTRRLLQKCLTSSSHGGKDHTDETTERGLDDLTGEELEKLFEETGSNG